jgi:hypothetical protein
VSGINSLSRRSGSSRWLTYNFLSKFVFWRLFVDESNYSVGSLIAEITLKLYSRDRFIHPATSSNLGFLGGRNHRFLLSFLRLEGVRLHICTPVKKVFTTTDWSSQRFARRLPSSVVKFLCFFSKGLCYRRCEIIPDSAETSLGRSLQEIKEFITDNFTYICFLLPGI